jgi:glycosyltransferase involved in cell wall biosynthesis
MDATLRRDITDSRVLLILRTPPPYGGGEIIGQQLEQLFADTFSILTFRRAAHRKQRQGRISVSNMTFGLRYAVQSALYLARRRPTVVYVDLPKDKLSFLRTCGILLAARSLGILVIGDLAGADFQFLDGHGLMQRVSHRLLSRLYAIRVLGATVAEALQRHGLTNAVVVPNGISEPPGADAEHAPGFDRLHFLYVGVVSQSKGVLTLLDFVHQLAARGNRPFVLDVIGEWESETTKQGVLETLVGQGLEQRVRFHGLLVGVEKWELYRRAHVLVHPTHWDGQPVTILEALAFGVPVVATRVGAIPDTISSGVEGYLMTDNTAEEIIVGVEEITRDSATYAAYSSRAREAYELRFSATVFGMRMAELLRSAVVGIEPRGVETASRQ